MLLLALLLVACEQNKGTDEAATEEPSAEQTEEKGDADAPFGVGKIEIIGSQGVYRMEEAPKPETVQEKLHQALLERELFAKSGETTVDGKFTYDVRKTDDGAFDMMIVGGVNGDNVRFDAGVNYVSSDERWKGKSLDEMIETGVEKVAEKLEAQAHVLGADVDGLIAILKDDEEPEEAHLLAVQEVRERSLREASEHVKPFLDSSHSSKLRVAAAATLVGLGDETVRGDVLKLAEELSRNRDPQYVPTLHILADLGGQEVITYLETVADGHSAPAVRKVASEALKDARGKGAP